MKKTAGRPSTDKVSRIRTKVWFRAVSLVSGMDAGELEIHFALPEKKALYTPGTRPRHWEKYRDGLICPKNKPDISGKLSIVERVEKEFPGTAAWISMPFWKVLSGRPMEMHELRDICFSFSEPIRSLLVVGEQSENRVFWRRQMDHDDLIKQLIQVGGIDSAAAILALIKEAELTQAQHLHQRGFVSWSICFSALRNHPVLKNFMQEIDEVILDRYSNTVYVSEDGEFVQMTKEHLINSLRQHSSGQN